MTDTLTPILTDNWDAERSWTLASYEARGGYAGLKKALTMAQDDVITAIDSHQIDGSEALIATIRSYRPGDTVKVTYLRGGKESTTELELGSDS